MDTTINLSRRRQILSFIAIFLFTCGLACSLVYFMMSARLDNIQNKAKLTIKAYQQESLQTDSLEKSFSAYIHAIHKQLEEVDELNQTLADPSQKTDNQARTDLNQTIRTKIITVNTNIEKAHQISEKYKNPVYNDLLEVLTQLTYEKEKWRNTIYLQQGGQVNEVVKDLETEIARLNQIIQTNKQKVSITPTPKPETPTNADESKRLINENFNLQVQIKRLENEKSALLSKITQCSATGEELKNLLKDRATLGGYSIRTKDKEIFDNLLEKLVRMK